jgi:hypothetical protein
MAVIVAAFSLRLRTDSFVGTATRVSSSSSEDEEEEDDDDDEDFAGWVSAIDVPKA